MRIVTITYELAERLAVPPRAANGWTTWHSATAYAAGKELREVIDTPIINLDELDFAAILQAASESNWMPPEYCSNDWVPDVCQFLRDGPPRQKLEIEGSPSDGYDAWFTDSDGNLNTVVCFSNPMATADWCERNGFAWEVIGLEGDPVQWLSEWMAQQ